MSEHYDDESYEEEGDNTILWVLLGAAIVYFLMRQNASAAPSGTVPLLPSPAGGAGTASTNVTFDASNPTAPAVAPYSPGSTVNVPPNVSDLTMAEALLSPFGSYDE
jgi:hypothetical protein